MLKHTLALAGLSLVLSTQVHATTHWVEVSLTGSWQTTVDTSISGYGNGYYDDVSNIITFSIFEQFNSGTIIDANVEMDFVIDVSTVIATVDITSCDSFGSLDACGGQYPTGPQLLDILNSSLSSLNGFGSFDTVTTPSEGTTAPDILRTYTISGFSEVPVPATAWLFGSALIGLAGIKRKK